MLTKIQARPVARFMKKRPDVMAIGGSRSVPSFMKGPSWHPQPVLPNSPYSGSNNLARFMETASNLGFVGAFEATLLIQLMQANARMFRRGERHA